MEAKSSEMIIPVNATRTGSICLPASPTTIKEESTAPNRAVMNGNPPTKPGKKMVEITTKKNAPAFMPKVPGDANGLFVKV